MTKRRMLTVINHQTGERIDIVADRKRGARLPGKRVSKRGTTYFEARRNRSDRRMSRL